MFSSWVSPINEAGTIPSLEFNPLSRHFQMSCNSSRFISCDSIGSNASHSTLGHLSSIRIRVYLVRSDHSASFVIFLLFLFSRSPYLRCKYSKTQSSTQYALGLSSMPQPFKDSNPENTLKNTRQPISGLHLVSGRCETLISVWEVLLIFLTVSKIHTPHPLYMAPRIHPSTEKQLLSTLPFGYDKKKRKRNSRKQVLHCETYNKNYQQTAGGGALRVADINASLTLTFPPQWGDPGVAGCVILEKGHR